MITVISAKGATVGDNLLTDILHNFLKSKGHNTSQHLAQSTSLAIFGGGGLIWEHTYPPILEEAQSAIKAGRKVIGIGLGVQGFHSLEKFSFLKHFKKITVRNPQSQTILKQLLDIDSTYTADLAWLHTPQLLPRETGKLGVVVPNMRAYPFLQRALAHFKDWKIKYIPFWPGMVAEYREAMKVTGGTIGPDHFNAVSDCELVIAGHYHGVVACFLTQTPCIVIPYRDKVRWLVDELSYDKFLAMTEDEVVIKLKQISRLENEVKEYMKVLTLEQRQKSLFNLRVIEAYLK